ncbi:MAG: hypothetical protein ACYDH9_20895 [Limisphaerales bacterium]
MSADFRTLFERSRYSGPTRWAGLDEQARKQVMRQHERFAVSMMGFALKHDPEFRKHFLENICKLKKDLAGANGWVISVELNNWGDLVLKHKASAFLVVVEFKIDSDLKEHQDPSKLLFGLPTKDGQCAGYGWEMEQMAARETWNGVRYATVEKRASWSKVRKTRRGISCVRCEWRDFLRSDVSKESGLEAEVYDCLGAFGISVFSARRITDMKLSSHATKPMAVLIKALSSLSVDFRPKLLAESGAEALGISLTKKDFPKIAKIVEPEGKITGWFGYESNSPLGPRLSVWFYCYSSTGVKTYARDRIKSALQKAGFDDKAFHEDGFSFGVFCKPGDSPGDAEWFARVLKAVHI